MTSVDPMSLKRGDLEGKLFIVVTVVVSGIVLLNPKASSYFASIGIKHRFCWSLKSTTVESNVLFANM